MSTYTNPEMVSACSDGVIAGRIAYKIYDTHTHEYLARTYAQRRRASAACDRLDTQYGSYRYSVCAVVVTD